MDRNPQNIKEKFTSKPTGNQTHYRCEAPEIKLKTHPKFTHHREAHDAGLTKPHHATPTLTSNLATVACLKEDDREVRERENIINPNCYNTCHDPNPWNMNLDT